MTDSDYLDWMVSHSAVVLFTRDGEYCWVKWYLDYETVAITTTFLDHRSAIDAAMKGEYTEFNA